MTIKSNCLYNQGPLDMFLYNQYEF